MALWSPSYYNIHWHNLCIQELCWGRILPLAESWGCSQWWRANCGSPWCDERSVQAALFVGTWHCSEITHRHREDSGEQVSEESKTSNSIGFQVRSMWRAYLPRCDVHQETSQNTTGWLRSVALRAKENKDTHNKVHTAGSREPRLSAINSN